MSAREIDVGRVEFQRMNVVNPVKRTNLSRGKIERKENPNTVTIDLTFYRCRRTGAFRDRSTTIARTDPFATEAR